MSSIISETSPSFFLGLFSTDVRILQDPESELVNDLYWVYFTIQKYVFMYPNKYRSLKKEVRGGEQLVFS